MPRRPSLSTWISRHVRPTDGPGTGTRLALEPWQRGFLQAVDHEQKQIVSLMAGSQVGKTLLGIGIAIRAAVDGQGVLMASSTEVSIRDLARRLDSTLEHAPTLAKRFPSPRSGTRGSGASWKDRQSRGGWVDRAGRCRQSASQLASAQRSRSRWPMRCHAGRRGSGPGRDTRSPCSARGCRTGVTTGCYWRSRAPCIRPTRLPCYSETATGAGWSICVRPATAGRRSDGSRWSVVTVASSRMIACLHCGTLHDERARRRMLRSGIWVPQKSEPTDEGSISFQLGRLDSARASLGAIVQGVSTGEPGGGTWRPARPRDVPKHRARAAG